MAQTMLRNLAAIVQNTANENIRMIDIAELHESPDNFFRIEHIEELAYTILAQGGVKDNLIVTPLATGGYEIVSGHRRKAAVQYLLDHNENISRLLPCLVQRYSDDDSKRLDLISMNVTTRQLSDQELWQSFRVLDGILQARKGAGEKFGRMREFLAQQLGTSRSQISKLQHISSSAEPEIQDALAVESVGYILTRTMVVDKNAILGYNNNYKSAILGIFCVLNFGKGDFACFSAKFMTGCLSGKRNPTGERHC